MPSISAYQTQFNKKRRPNLNQVKKPFRNTIKKIKKNIELCVKGFEKVIVNNQIGTPSGQFAILEPQNPLNDGSELL